MRKALGLALLALAGSALLTACGGGTSGGGDGAAGDGRVDVYARSVQPVLDARCGGANCHGTARGGYLLEGVSYAALLSQPEAVVPGSPEKSRLYTSMAAGRMTFKGPTPAEIALIEAWIRDGAPQYGEADDLPEPDPPPEPVGLDVCAGYCHGVERAAWLAGPHGNLEAVGPTGRPLDLGLDATGFPSYGYGGLGALPTCTVACHDPLGDGARLAWGLTGNEPRPVVGCESCHGGGSRHADAPLTDPPLPAPDGSQCTACHRSVDAAHGEKSPDAWSGGAVGVGTFAGDRTTSDTHRDDPATSDVIEGYVVDPRAERPCGACHDGHAPDLAIPRQWVASAHGGGLLAAKAEAARTVGVAAVLTAGVGRDRAGAWTALDWDHTFKADGADADALPDKDRADCQRCHTATGLKNFLAAAASRVAYDPARNDFSHLEGWALHSGTDGATVASGQNELLYCWGCHADSAGRLRKPGPLAFTYSNGATAAYPDASGSGACVACHSGLATGESVKRDPADFANRSLVSAHSLPAAGTLYRKTGFEYYDAEGDHDAKYGNAPWFRHDAVGTPSAPGTGASGPCAGCHMSGPEGHLLRPLERDDETGEIAAVTAAACATCHNGAHGTALVAKGGDAAKAAAAAAFLREEAEGWEAALAALEAALAARGYHVAGAYPYVFTAPYVEGYVESAADPHCAANLPVRNWNTGGTSTFAWDGRTCASSPVAAGDEGTGRRNMGAAFNLSLLRHEPGAWVHNPRYAKRLVFDSLDWLDDHELDGAVDLTGHDRAYEVLVRRNQDGSPAGPIGAAPRP